jgi:hypothetical protein
MTSSPLKLRDINRTKLEDMGMDPLLIELFIDNSAFTPREQTFLVGALDALKKTKNRDQYIRFAIRTHDREMSGHRAAVASMYANYDRVVAPLESFVPLGSFVAARTADSMVFIAPLDYLVWTRDAALVTQYFGDRAKSMPGIRKKELWLPGILSKRSRVQLEANGWELHERCESRLAKEIQWN